MVSYFRKASVVLLAGVGFTSALTIKGRGLFDSTSFSGISSTCQSTLLAISSDPEASACFNIPGLVAIATLQANSSVIPPLNTWLEGFCAADPCSNSTISAVIANVTSGCQPENSTGVSQSVIQSFTGQVAQFYPTVRNIACLKTASNNTLCATSTLLDLQQFAGPLTIDNFQQRTNFSTMPIPVIPANLTCTGCIQAAIETLVQDQALLAANPTIQTVVANQCGSGFLSQPQASDVVTGTGTAAPTGTVAALSSNGASDLGATFNFKTTSFIAIVAGLFALFA